MASSSNSSSSSSSSTSTSSSSSSSSRSDSSARRALVHIQTAPALRLISVLRLVRVLKDDDGQHDCQVYYRCIDGYDQ